MDINLESLGITKEELQKRVVNRLCDDIGTQHFRDEDGEPYSIGISEGMNNLIKEHIDSSVLAIANEHVLPLIRERIETLVIQETTKWGEKVGEELTFIEYMVSRADHYLKEPIDYNGRSEAEARARRDTWHGGSTTRIVSLVDRHFEYAIKTSMEQAVKDANKSIVAGIQETAKIKLAEIAKALKVTVKTS